MLAALGIGERRFSAGAFWAAVFILAAWTIVFATASWDYHGYLVYFQCANTAICDASSFAGVETSLSWLSRAVAFVFGNDGGPVLVAVYSVLAVTIKLSVIRRGSTAFGVALFAYLCFGFFVHEMTQVRAGLAIGLLWLAMADWTEPGRKPIAALWFVAAVMIHNSAIVAAVVPILLLVRPTLPRVLAAWAIAAAIGRTVQAYVMSSSDLLELVIVGRFGSYLSGIDSEITRAPQFPIYVVALLVIVFCALFSTKITEWNKIERIALASVIGGLAFYLATFWFPILGLRAMEMLTSPFPFVAAATWQRTQSLTVKIIIIISISLTFYSLVIRNGIMKDFVIVGSSQYLRIMEGFVN